jgi:cytochrome c oxidase assembly protein subunit 15
VVTAHLAGGLATLALLWWLVLRHGGIVRMMPDRASASLRPWALGGLALLCLQILLGGWTSTNYAALACTELPTCYGGLWWPPTDFGEAFVIWRGTGVDYEFGVLDSAARTAIHLTHRVGALIVLIYLSLLGSRMLRAEAGDACVRLGVLLFATLGLQIGLGIANVLWHLPLPVAVSHNGGAALLLLVMVTLLYATRSGGIRGNVRVRA